MIKEESCNSYDELSQKAKQVFVDNIKKTIEAKGKAVIAIPGGRSVVGLLKLLSKDDLDWSKVHLFITDERKVEKGTEDNNYMQAINLFLIKVPEINGLPYDNQAGPEDYTNKLNDATNGDMKFDVVLLASGEDGHVASLFPDHWSIKHEDKEYFVMEDAPKLPEVRVSASRFILEDSDCIVLLFASKAKQDAYNKFNNNDLTEEQCPAQITKNAKELYVFTFFGE